MKTYSRMNNSCKSIIFGAGIGGLISVFVTLMGTAAVAWLIDGEKLTESSIGLGAAAVLLVATIIGCVVAIAVVGKRKLITAAATGAVYLLSLFALTALFFGGQYVGVGYSLLMIAGAVFASVLISGGSPKRVKHSKQKR